MINSRKIAKSCILSAQMAKTYNINGVEFLKLNVIYPLLVVTFQNENFLCEIVVRKK